MGAPVDTGIENFEEVILGLSKADRVKLLGWIAESLVEEAETSNQATPSSKTSEENDTFYEPLSKNEHLGEIRTPESRSDEERLSSVKALNNSRTDTRSAEEIIDEIYSARTIDEPKSFFND
jgi:hypothetical protein